MKYAVEKIEKNIVICQNLETRELIERQLEEFPPKIKEGDIVVFLENKFIIDKKTTTKRRESLRARLEKLKMLK